MKSTIDCRSGRTTRRDILMRSIPPTSPHYTKDKMSESRIMKLADGKGEASPTEGKNQDHMKYKHLQVTYCDETADTSSQPKREASCQAINMLLETYSVMYKTTTLKTHKQNKHKANQTHHRTTTNHTPQDQVVLLRNLKGTIYKFLTWFELISS